MHTLIFGKCILLLVVLREKQFSMYDIHLCSPRKNYTLPSLLHIFCINFVACILQIFFDHLNVKIMPCIFVNQLLVKVIFVVSISLQSAYIDSVLVCTIRFGFDKHLYIYISVFEMYKLHSFLASKPASGLILFCGNQETRRKRKFEF